MLITNQMYSTTMASEPINATAADCTFNIGIHGTNG